MKNIDKKLYSIGRTIIARDKGSWSQETEYRLFVDCHIDVARSSVRHWAWTTEMVWATIKVWPLYS